MWIDTDESRHRQIQYFGKGSLHVKTLNISGLQKIQRTMVAGRSIVDAKPPDWQVYYIDMEKSQIWHFHFVARPVSERPQAVKIG